MQISASGQATLNNAANNFVFALYDASAPTVLLESQAPPKPYGNPIQVTFNYNCLSGHIYIIKLWESADTTPTGVVRNSFSQSVNSNTSTVTIKMDEYLEADVTTGFTSNTTSYVNTDWAGWEKSIERVGLGTMVPDNSDNTDPNYTDIPTGGFSLVQSGDVFQPHEKFVVRFTPQVTTGPTEIGTPSPVFAAGQIITADKTLTSADSGQALLLQSATNKLVVTMPPLSSVADFVFFYFFSNGGSHINAVIQASGTDKFTYKDDRSNIILGQCETARVFKAFGKWNIENELTGMNKVGEVFFSNSNTILNTLACAGQLVNRDVYPRLWEHVQSLSNVVGDFAWTSTFVIVDSIVYYTNKGFFSTGDGSTNLRVQLIKNFIRPVDGIRSAGSLELQTIQRHSHHINGSKQNGFGGFGAVPGVNPDGSEDGGFTDEAGDDETKPTNIGMFALIRI